MQKTVSKSMEKNRIYAATKWLILPALRNPIKRIKR